MKRCFKKLIRYWTHIDADMHDFLENEGNHALGMLMVEATKQHVANAFGWSVSTVTRLA